MKTAAFAAFALSVLLCGPALAAAPDYRIVNRIKVPDSGFGYTTFDFASGCVLLVLPQGAGTVRIVDGASDKSLADIPAGKGPECGLRPTATAG